MIDFDFLFYNCITHQSKIDKILLLVARCNARIKMNSISGFAFKLPILYKFLKMNVFNMYFKLYAKKVKIHNGVTQCFL